MNYYYAKHLVPVCRLTFINMKCPTPRDDGDGYHLEAQAYVSSSLVVCGDCL